ncbi:chloramphenicol phosphotransferase CPT family protein [Nocardioides sp. TRM66260-LWL]|uniref:chloramphenicol phosphotransferase CPT family protein n=1 Tax=Nocardioides sp. TRM66260-LWL TaxID=2874478 RepID=UPI001CC71D99|nr:chloramphenicol phosphotransferase CPT family protein [Nocardioides sp. TRM66260-LWL]MBZ5733274.1 chloramphenicol phosphotransferase CPT family protein [Nocardioides sp. TRM66260-LWL]
MDEQADGRVGAQTPDGVRRSRVPARVIVLDGGSSSGKTTLARALRRSSTDSGCVSASTR